MSTQTERMTAALRELVLSGVLAPGVRLQEVGLAERLGASRTPVREALHSLAAEGLLDRNSNRGYQVRRISLQDILDLFDVRATLEAMGCRIVAERGLSPDVVAAMRDNLGEGDRLTAGPGWSVEHEIRWEGINGHFHDMLLAATGNRALREAVQQTRRMPLMHGTRHQTHDAALLRQLYGDRAQCQRSLGDHKLIFAAILGHEGSRAEHLIREHIYRNRDGFRRVADEISGGLSSAA